MTGAKYCEPARPLWGKAPPRTKPLPPNRPLPVSPQPSRTTSLQVECLYSSVVEPQSSKLKVLGSISSGGFHTAVGTRRCSAGRVFNSTWVTIQLIDVRTLRMQTVEGKTRREQKKAETRD